MDQTQLETALDDLPVGEIRYYERIDSTNTAAARWAEAGAPDLSLVVADEQTAGRGRLGRRWFTPPGAALAFSLLLDLQVGTASSAVLPERRVPALTALGAVAVSCALRHLYDLSPEIKWPNDVLLKRRKVAGVLVETHWQGESPTSAVLGIGINVATSSIPQETDLLYPAACVQAVLGRPVDRWVLLHAVLEELLAWRSRLSSKEFLQTWNDQLAFKGEWVQVGRADLSGSSLNEGTVIGLSPDGCLQLRTSSGNVATIQSGELTLRPVDKTPE
jgi:BirA family biotin operon repressor/biotin-[acetyl-CoA-carboxylase] ligase